MSTRLSNIINKKGATTSTYIMNKIDSLFVKIMALIIVSLLILRCILVADASWDTLAYHLPFSAMRVGLLSPQNFVLPEHLVAAYNGFPSAIYYIKGLLWYITGRPESMQLVNILSIIIFVLFANKTLHLPAEWLLFGVLAIPIIHVGVTTNMTDVPANIGMAIMFISLYKLVIRPSQLGKKDFVWLLVGCLIASGSKPQSVVLGIILFASYVVTFLLLRKQLNNEINVLNNKKLVAFWLVICAFAISYPALINIYNYGNPIYPMQVNIGNLHLQGVFSVNNWSDPKYLGSLPQQLKWLLSVFEFHAFDFRPIPYTVDQGDVPLTAKSFRMGGYFFPLVIMSIFIIFLSSRTMKYILVRVLLLLFYVTFVVSSLPGSNELRYYSFWAIGLVTIAIDQLEWLKEKPFFRGIYVLYKMLIISCFLFVVFITGAQYLKLHGLQYSDLAKGFERDRTVFSDGGYVFYCYENDYRGAIFDSVIFSENKNVVIIKQNDGVCGGD